MAEYATISPMKPAANSSRIAQVLIVLAFAAIWAAFIHSRAYSSNDASRLAAIESLVQRGTWAIDDSPFATVDKIKLGDHFYSDKPPILSWAGAGVYAVLHQAFGLTLQPWGCAPERTATWCRAVFEAGEADWAYFILTLLLIALPGALMLVLVYDMARRSGWPTWSSLLFVLVLGLGTAIFPYSTVFNNHIPAAAATLVAVYALLTTTAPGRLRLFIVGLAAALAAAIDLSAAIFTIGLLLYAVVRYRRRAGWFVLGLLVPVAITILLDYQIVGSPVLPYMVPQGYAYAGSELNATLAGTRHADDVPRYAFDLLVGDRGVLLFYPIVLWYLYGTWRAARLRDITVRWLARLMLIAGGLYVLYFILLTDTFGGYSFSPRWFLNLMPLLAIFVVIAQKIDRMNAGTLALGAVAAYSIVQATFGALNPWNPAFPMLRLEVTQPAPVTAPNVAISGYSNYSDVPDTLRKLIGVNNVVPRRFDARRGMVIFPGEGWWFVSEASPPAAELAGRFGLNITTTHALNADLRPALDGWLRDFRSLGQPVVGDEVQLLGARWDRQGDNIDVITAWQMETTPPPDVQRRISLELLDDHGNRVQHSEVMAARYTSLQAGDILVQVQSLNLHDLAAGRYQLRLGVLDLATNQLLPMPDGSATLLVDTVQK